MKKLLLLFSLLTLIFSSVAFSQSNTSESEVVILNEKVLTGTVKMLSHSHILIDSGATGSYYGKPIKVNYGFILTYDVGPELLDLLQVAEKLEKPVHLTIASVQVGEYSDGEPKTELRVISAKFVEE